MTISFTPLFLLLLSFAVNGELPAKRVHCPDGRSFCPEDTTCCQLSDEGHYGCCPLPKAICCNDHLHCCPEDTQCDLQHQSCLQSDGRAQPFHRKVPAITQNGGTVQQKGTDDATAEVICPDRSSKCPPRATCCPLGNTFGRRRKEFWRREIDAQQSTSYGCCPAERAVCCADHVHCCPHGTQCDAEGGACVGAKVHRSEPMKKSPARKVGHFKSAQQTEPPARLCGDSVGHRQRMSACESNEKCCRHRDGEGRKAMGCCPFEEGQCCAHSAHCCPAGFACAREEGRCVSEQNGISLSTQLFPIRPTTKRRFHGSEMPTECPDGTFCGSPTDICCAHSLPTTEGQQMTTFGCCPLSKGICCKGSPKCCPMGYKCSAEGCERMDVREQIVRLFLDKN